MRYMTRWTLITLLLLNTCSTAEEVELKPLDAETMWRLVHLASPAISPDGRQAGKLGA